MSLSVCLTLHFFHGNIYLLTPLSSSVHIFNNAHLPSAISAITISIITSSLQTSISFVLHLHYRVLLSTSVSSSVQHPIPTSTAINMHFCFIMSYFQKPCTSSTTISCIVNLFLNHNVLIADIPILYLASLASIHVLSTSMSSSVYLK